jgi:hypothetical protein
MTKSAMLFAVLIIAGAVDLQAQPVAKDEALPGRDSLTRSDPGLSQEAVEYHRRLTEPMLDLKKASYKYTQTVARTRRIRAVERSRQDLLKVIASNKEFCKSIDPFHGDSTLKSELNRYLDLLYIVVKQDFDKILDMEDIAAQSYDQAEAHQLALDLAVGKMQASFDVLRKADLAFFKKYGITLREDKDELSMKIEKANRAFDYYNAIYRIFYKANKEASYAREASISKDIVALEQHTMTLVSFTGEGLNQLKQKSAYDGDKELLEAATKLLEFYDHEGKVTFPANVDFNMKADIAHKADRKFHSIKENERKQGDVDEFNHSVDIFNKAVKEINQINHVSFATNNKLIALWNKQVEQFFVEHL